MNTPSWKVQNFVYLPLAVVLVGLVFYWYWLSTLPIHELYETKMTPSVVTPGADGRLCTTLTVVSIRSRRCEVTVIRRTFARVSDNQVMMELMSSGGLMEPNGKRTEGPPTHICFPTELFEDGEYLASTRADNRCSDGTLTTAISDFARFQIRRNP
jgi:hypothetical protein